MFKRKSIREPVPETEVDRIKRIAWNMYAKRFRERTGNKTVIGHDIKFAQMNGKRFIIADGKRHDLLDVLPEIFR